MNQATEPTEEEITNEFNNSIILLREKVKSDAQKAPIIIDALEGIVERLTKNPKEMKKLLRITQEDREVISEVEKMYKPYVTDNKIITFRNFGDELSKLSNIPLPKEMKSKGKLMRWLRDHYETFKPILDKKIADENKSIIEKSHPSIFQPEIPMNQSIKLCENIKN